MELVVLASGKGTRLKNLNQNHPKCLLKIKNEKTLIDYISKNFKKFKKTFIIGGYKHHLLKKYEEKNVKLIINKKFNTTNMVYSLSCAKKSISSDIIVVYADILFDEKIINKLIKKKGNILPLKKNWLEVWKSRMSYKEIKMDSENIVLKNNKIIKIGGKYTKYPKAQYMGIIKFRKKDFFKAMNFFKNLNNYKIDMTSFLDLCIKKEIIDLSYFLTNRFWYEIDTPKDYKSFKKMGLKL